MPETKELSGKWLKIANVSPNEIIWNQKSYLPEEYSKEYTTYILNENDIVVAMTRPLLGRKLKIAKITKKDSNPLLNQRVGKFQFINETLWKEFFYFSVQSKDFIDSMLLKLLGSDPPNISSAMIESIFMPVPPLQEQKQIASILSTVDDKIDILQSKKTSYTTLKKGLMAQLLTGQMRVKI